MERCLAFVGVVALLACQVAPPSVDEDATEGIDASGTAYADLAIAWTENGSLATCTDSPGCPMTGTCSQHEALGAPDDQTFELEVGGQLEVAFFCSQLLEHGLELTDELRIWATVPPGARAIVSVGLDGSNYDTIDVLDADNTTFDLARTNVQVARFVRIVHDSGDPIAIDALESL